MSKRLRSSEVCADCSGPGELHRPGPLPSALLTRTTAPGPPPLGSAVPTAEPGTPCPRSRRGGTEAALRRKPSQACQTQARRGPPPSRPSLPSCPLYPRPSREAAGSGPGLLLQQEGAWAIHRKANYRSTMRASSCLRPPETAGVTLLSPPPPPPKAPLHEGALPGVSDIRHFPPPKRARGPVNDFSALDIWAPAPPRSISRMSVSCERNQHLGGNAYVKFGDLKSPSSN